MQGYRGMLAWWRQRQQAIFGGDDLDRRAEFAELVTIVGFAIGFLAATAVLIAITWK